MKVCPRHLLLFFVNFHNLIKLRKILFVVESLRGEVPTELRNLFKFARDSHHVNTRVAIVRI
jgi:hypothetical protein